MRFEPIRMQRCSFIRMGSDPMSDKNKMHGLYIRYGCKSLWSFPLLRKNIINKICE